MVNGTEIAKGVDALVDTRQSLRVAGRAKGASKHPSSSHVSPQNAGAALTEEQLRAMEELRAEDLAYQPKATDKILGMAGGAVGAAGLLSFLGPIGVKVFSKPIEWTGKLFKSDRIKGMAEKIRAPAEYVERHTFADLGEKMGVRKAAGKASQAIASGIAAVAETVDGKLHFGNALQGRAIGRAHRRFMRAKEHAAALDVSQIPAEFREHFAVLHEHVTGASHVGELQAHFAPSAASGLEGAADAAKSMLRNAEGTIVNAAEKAASRPGFAESLTVAEGVVNTLKKEGASKETARAASRFVESTGKMAGSIEHAASMGNVGRSIRGMPANLASSKITHGVMNGAFIAGSGLSMVGDARDFKTQLRTLKEMYADMTGKKVESVSTMRVLMGDVPEPVRAARSLLLKKLAVRESTDAVGMGVNIMQAVNHRFNGVKAMAAFILPDIIGRGADSMMGETSLPAYASFKHSFLEAKAAGQKLPAEVYTAFVGEVSPELRRRGGSHSRFAEEIGKQYAAEGKNPAEIMNEIANGKLMARVHNAMDKAEAAKKAASAPAETSAVSHTQRLAGAKASMPVVGEHTGKVVQEAAATEQGMTRA